jgi:hypothetical protein
MIFNISATGLADGSALSLPLLWRCWQRLRHDAETSDRKGCARFAG